jgi:hypothetical protein
MTEMGQSRHFDRAQLTSGLPRLADMQFFDLKLPGTGRSAPRLRIPRLLFAPRRCQAFPRLYPATVLHSYSQKSGSRSIGSRTPVKSRILLNRAGDCRFLALSSRVLVNQNNEEASPNADQ